MKTLARVLDTIDLPTYWMVGLIEAIRQNSCYTEEQQEHVAIFNAWVNRRIFSGQPQQINLLLDILEMEASFRHGWFVIGERDKEIAKPKVLDAKFKQRAIDVIDQENVLYLIRSSEQERNPTKYELEIKEKTAKLIERNCIHLGQNPDMITLRKKLITSITQNLQYLLLFDAGGKAIAFNLDNPTEWLILRAYLRWLQQDRLFTSWVYSAVVISADDAPPLPTYDLLTKPGIFDSCLHYMEKQQQADEQAQLKEELSDPPED